MMALLNGRARGQLEGQGGGGTPRRVAMLGMVGGLFACATCIAPDSVVTQIPSVRGPLTGLFMHRTVCGGGT